MSGERLYRVAVRDFSVALLVIGIAVQAITLANVGGPASLGFLMGIAFAAVGAGRLWLSARMGE